MGSPLTRRRPGIPAIFLAVSTALSCLTPTLAADKVIDWTYGTGQGGNEFDILQCQAMSVDWSVGDGMRHSLYEFESEAAYNWCDFSKAKMLLGRSRRAEVELSGEETVDVATRWFGSRGNNASASLNSGGSDCSDGMMKFTLKTSPLLQFKFPGYMCKGNSLLVKKDDDIRDCRTWCKFHRDCVAIEYNAYRGICTIYSREGLTGVRTPFSSEILEASTCEVAITDCSGSEDTSSLGIEIPGGRNEIPGGRNNGPIPPPTRRSPFLLPVLPPSPPTPRPTSSPTRSAQPTDKPSSSAPTSRPSARPTEAPTKTPSQVPSRQPSTEAPTKTPSHAPSRQPSTEAPTKTPSHAPSRQPSTEAPTKTPSQVPSRQPPTEAPTKTPSQVPSRQPPTEAPTKMPSQVPSLQPSEHSSPGPTIYGSSKPSSQPSSMPSPRPSRTPSLTPSSMPTTCVATGDMCTQGGDPCCQTGSLLPGLSVQCVQEDGEDSTYCSASSDTAEQCFNNGDPGLCTGRPCCSINGLTATCRSLVAGMQPMCIIEV